jgi:hypothetical protein
MDELEKSFFNSGYNNGYAAGDNEGWNRGFLDGFNYSFIYTKLESEFDFIDKSLSQCPIPDLTDSFRVIEILIDLMQSWKTPKAAKKHITEGEQRRDKLLEKAKSLEKVVIP